MKAFALSCLVCLVFSIIGTDSIHISTSDLEEVYSGPGGVPSPGWDSLIKPKTYSNYVSVAQFLFTETSNEEYYYLSVQEVFAPPQLKVESGADVIDPYVFGVAADGYFLEGGTYWEELPDLNVFFNCKKEGNAIVSLTIQTSLLLGESGTTQTINETVKFYFEKECSSPGFREGFSIGNRDGSSDDVVKHGVVQQRWTVESYYFLDKNPIVFEPKDQLSTFHISISNPLYGNQFYFAPIVSIEDDDMLEVQVRGNAQNGGIAVGMPESLVLVYDCLQDGDTEITVTIPLQDYFGDIQFGFTKVCKAPEDDNQMPGTINIGASRSDYAGIVSDSITSLFWLPESPTIEISADEILTNFYVSTQSGKSQQILKPIISVNPPTAFGVTISGNIRDGGIVTGSPQHFTLNYICDRVAEATVVVTIKMPHAKTVEFSFVKKCKALKRHTDHVWTANQLLGILIVCSIAIVVAIGCLYKKRSTKVYKPFPSEKPSHNY